MNQEEPKQGEKQLEEKTKEEEKPKEEQKEEKPKEKTKPTVEKSSTCAKCGKNLNRKSWYYRNGKYYCNKRCWKSSKQKSQKK